MLKPRFTMIVLLIEDLPRSLAFYRRLGMEFPTDADGTGAAAMARGPTVVIKDQPTAPGVPSDCGAGGGCRTHTPLRALGVFELSAAVSVPLRPQRG